MASTAVTYYLPASLNSLLPAPSLPPVPKRCEHRGIGGGCINHPGWHKHGCMHVTPGREADVGPCQVLIRGSCCWALPGCLHQKFPMNLGTELPQKGFILQSLGITVHGDLPVGVSPSPEAAGGLPEATEQSNQLGLRTKTLVSLPIP